MAQALRRRAIRWGALCAVGLIILGAAAGIDFARRTKAAELRATSDNLQAEIVHVRTGLRTVTAELAQVKHHLDHASALRTKRAWSGMIALIDRCMPENCWLTSISTDPEKPTSGTGAVKRVATKVGGQKTDEVVMIDAPRRLKIVGYAAKASEPNEFVRELGKARVFSRVELERSQREPILDGTYYRFEFFCEW